MLVAVGACVGDGGGRLGGEQHQHLLVLAGEFASACLPRQKEVADVHSPVTHRRRLHGLRHDRVRGKTERPDVAVQVLHFQGAFKVADVFAQSWPLGPVQQLAVLFAG